MLSYQVACFYVGSIKCVFSIMNGTRYKLLGWVLGAY